jgi:endonuclease/exonuclease/phosphatase family metal-dependent hydrolase
MEGPAILDHERRLRSRLSASDVERLRAIPTRRELERSPIWAATRDAVEELTAGLEFGRPRSPAPRPESGFVRAVTWNIERGNRLDATLAFLAENEAIRACDVLLLNEVDIGMARSGNRNVAAEIADRLGFEYVFGNSYLCLGHGDARDGQSAAANEVGLHGNTILSRWPLVRAENVSVAVTRDKFESSEKRLGHKKALWAEVDAPIGRLAVVSAHLDPYASPEQRVRQLADVLRTIESRQIEAPVLLGGDLNTTTYDLETIPRLLWNVALKMARGGFPHALDHYMRPHALYERALFEALRAAHFEIEPFNDMTRGSARYEVGTFDSESKIRDHLPGFVVHLLRWRLKPWNGVAPLKIDWFAARGLRALGGGERRDPGGRESMSPTVFERARWQGQALSDHDPVLVDVAL